MLVSSNYAQLRCEDCNKIFHIMPDEKFHSVSCDCVSQLDNMTLEALRKLGKEKKIHSAMQMGREKLLEKLQEV